MKHIFPIIYSVMVILACIWGVATDKKELCKYEVYSGSKKIDVIYRKTCNSNLYCKSYSDEGIYYKSLGKVKTTRSKL